MLSEVAKDFVRLRLAKAEGVLGVLLVGSPSVGYADSHSDIDLEVFVTKESFTNMRRTYEAYEAYKGTDISWEWMTLQELEDALGKWRNDVDLWVYSRSVILFDREGCLENLLARYKRYPKKIWLEKLFLYWYHATGNAPYDSGKAILRKDFKVAQLYLTQALEYYTALIFILNRSFVPYRKWRLREMNRLKYKPTGYTQILHKILTTTKWTKQEFEAKQEIVYNLVSELKKKLLDSGVAMEKLENPWRFKVNSAPRI